jgi:hypothetical protein
MKETPEHVTKWLQTAIQKLGPAVAGSLCLRKSPCVRKNCPACARGDGHASYALYGRLKGKRFSIYVPNDLVPEISAAIANGQRVQELLSEAGVRFTQALKESRKREKRR